MGDYYLIAGEDEPRGTPIGPWGQRHLQFIKNHLLQIVQKVKCKHLRRKQKFRFEPQETKLIRMCLIQWRNQQLQAQKQGAAEAISDLIILFAQ